MTELDPARSCCMVDAPLFLPTSMDKPGAESDLLTMSQRRNSNAESSDEDRGGCCRPPRSAGGTACIARSGAAGDHPLPGTVAAPELTGISALRRSPFP